MILFYTLSFDAIPKSLIPRDSPIEFGMVLTVFLAFAALSLTNFLRPGIFRALFRANVKTYGLISFLRESLPLRAIDSQLLLLHYLLTGGAVFYLSSRGLSMSTPTRLLGAFFLPLIVLTVHIFSLRFVGWVSGEPRVFREPIALKIVGAQLLGLVYFGCALCWVFDQEHDVFFRWIVLVIFLGESFFRWSKSILAVLRNGVDWYYIILYFCVLEILPLSAIYVLTTGFFE